MYERAAMAGAGTILYFQTSSVFLRMLGSSGISFGPNLHKKVYNRTYSGICEIVIDVLRCPLQ